MENVCLSTPNHLSPESNLRSAKKRSAPYNRLNSNIFNEENNKLLNHTQNTKRIRHSELEYFSDIKEAVGSNIFDFKNAYKDNQLIDSEKLDANDKCSSPYFDSTISLECIQTQNLNYYENNVDSSSLGKNFMLNWYPSDCTPINSKHIRNEDLIDLSFVESTKSSIGNCEDPLLYYTPQRFSNSSNKLPLSEILNSLYDVNNLEDTPINGDDSCSYHNIDSNTDTMNSELFFTPRKTLLDAMECESVHQFPSNNLDDLKNISTTDKAHSLSKLDNDNDTNNILTPYEIRSILPVEEFEVVSNDATDIFNTNLSSNLLSNSPYLTSSIQEISQNQYIPNKLKKTELKIISKKLSFSKIIRKSDKSKVKKDSIYNIVNQINPNDIPVASSIDYDNDQNNIFDDSIPSLTPSPRTPLRTPTHSPPRLSSPSNDYTANFSLEGVKLPTTPKAPLRPCRSKRNLVHGILNCNRRVVKDAIQCGEDPNNTIDFPSNITGKYEKTLPILAAAKLGNIGLIKTLIEGGAEINSVNVDGQNALHILFINALPNQHIKVSQTQLCQNPKYFKELQTNHAETITEQNELPKAWLNLKVFLDKLEKSPLDDPTSPSENLSNLKDIDEYADDPFDTPKPTINKNNPLPSWNNFNKNNVSTYSFDTETLTKYRPSQQDILICAEFLIENGIDFNRYDLRNKTPLAYAIENGFSPNEIIFLKYNLNAGNNRKNLNSKKYFRYKKKKSKINLDKNQLKLNTSFPSIKKKKRGR